MPSFPQHRLKNSDFRKEQLDKLREESKIDFNPNNSINKSSKSTMSNKVLVNVSKPTNVKNTETKLKISEHIAKNKYAYAGVSGLLGLALILISIKKK